MKLKNSNLKMVANFLKDDLKTSGKDNIHRMRLVKAIEAQDEAIGKEELELLKEYAETDEDGELKQTEKGGFKISNPQVFKKQQEALFNEYYTIDDSNLNTALETVKQLVNDFDGELSGESAEAHFILSEALEQ